MLKKELLYNLVVKVFQDRGAIPRASTNFNNHGGELVSTGWGKCIRQHGEEGWLRYQTFKT